MRGFSRPLRPLAACAALLAAAWGCANPGTPTGGPRDVRPPRMVSSLPEAGATDFGGKAVTIYFDENVQLKDADQKFVMSPPTAKKPRVEAHARYVRVAFDEELLPATTYTLDFADCLSDLNEGNVFENFTFTFSTGGSTDSMMISGNVYDASTLMPVEGIYVLLHGNLADTAFRKATPARVAKTDVRGRFAIKNVPAGAEYDIFALDDQNRNFLFDQAGEKIAWLGRRVAPSFETRQVPDSVKTDSTFVLNDTVRFYYRPTVRDTLVFTPDSLVLFAFDEDVYDQYIKTDERKQRNKLNITFNKPMPRRPRVSFVGREGGDVAVFQYSPTNDTVQVWMTDTSVWRRDSVVIAVSYLVADSLGSLVERTDTLKEWHFEKKTEAGGQQRRRRRDKAPEKPKVELLAVKVAGAVAPYADLPITAPTPFASFCWDSVRVFQKVDTLLKQVPFVPVDDTVNVCRKAVKVKWEPGGQYVVTIDSASVSDVYGLVNGPLKQNVGVTALDKYGTLYVDVDSVPDGGLLQLTDTKGNVLRQNYLRPNGKAGFRYLKPGDYMLRILVDDNRDGKWTTGSWDERRQPETLIYYMEKVNVRQNWDIHVDFSTRHFSTDAYARKFGTQTRRRR